MADWTLTPAETIQHAEMWEKSGQWKRLCDASVRVAKRLQEYDLEAKLAEKEVGVHLARYERLGKVEEVDVVRRSYRVGTSGRLSEIEGFAYGLGRLLMSLAAICRVSPEAALGVVARGFHNAFVDILISSQKRLLLAGAAAEAIGSLLWVAQNRNMLVDNRKLLIGLCSLLDRCRKQDDVPQEESLLAYIGSLISRAGKTTLDLFSDLDVNRDGRLERNEISQLLRTLQPELKEDQLKMIFDKIDIDGDGAVSLQELCLALRPASAVIARINESLASVRKMPKDLFLHFDASGDGQLDRKELDGMMLQWQPDLSPEELASLFAFFDRDGDGSVSARELAESMDEVGNASRGCLKCLAGLAQTGEKYTLMLMELKVLDNALELMTDRSNALQDAELCARVLELCTRMLSNVSDPKHQSEFIRKDGIDTAWQAMNTHERKDEVVSWGLAMIHTALECQELRRDVKDRVPSVDKFEDLHKGRAHVEKLVVQVATQLQARDY